jgi:pilus assembly protein CpaF
MPAIPPRPTLPQRSPSGAPAAPRASGPARSFTPSDTRQADRTFELKSMVHQKLLNSINTDQIKLISRDRIRMEIGVAVESLLMQENIPMNIQERDRIIEEILDEVFGLGPLEPLLKDPSVTDIMVNNFRTVYVERNGVLQKTMVRFKDDRHLHHIIEKIVAAAGRRIDEASPIVDARLADGSRLTAVIPPLALAGPTLAIRRFGRRVMTNEELIKNFTLTSSMLDLLGACVEARLTLVVSGGTGTGKTTLLNALSRFIPETERVVTIEDVAELRLQQRHVVRLETRPANIEGTGAIVQRDLVINALRMRPDRILVGEVRGPEALDMLQAMNTGHDGSMTTVHANSPTDAFHRLETMILMADMNLPDRIIRQQLVSAIQLVVQITRLTDGSRRVVRISEVAGLSEESIELQDIFEFERTGLTDLGKVTGRFRATGVKPHFLERLRAAGIHLPPAMFHEVVEVK